MTVLAVTASVILLVELGLTALSAVIGLQAWLERMKSLARVELSRSAQAAVFVLTTAAGALIIYGFWVPWPRFAGGALSAVMAGLVLVQQLRYGGRGKAVIPYSLFCGCGIAVALSALI